MSDTLKEFDSQIVLLIKSRHVLYINKQSTLGHASHLIRAVGLGEQ